MDERPVSAAESTPVYEGRGVVLAGLAVIFLTFAGFGTWAAMAPLSGAIIAGGVVKVDTNRKTVQHLEGGIVQEIRVRDGDRVETGQTLIVIEDEQVSANLDLLQGQFDAELAKAARLRSERDGQATIAFPGQLTERGGDAEVREILASEQTFFVAKRNALDAQVTLLEDLIARVHTEIEGLTRQVQAEDAAIGLLRQEIAANEELQQKHYVEETRLLTLRRQVEEYQARLGEHQAEIAIARQKITGNELRIASLRDEYLQTAADELTASQGKIFDIEERLRPLEDASRRQQIVAPIAGRVVDLKVFTVGGVIAPREPLLDIVPDDNPLIIEARVSVESIEELQPGMQADIRMTAYKSGTTPLLRGTVTYVSADRLTDEHSGVPYYVAHITVDKDSLEAVREVRLLPGMPAEVFIQTRARTALDYLLDPITAALRRSMRES